MRQTINKDLTEVTGKINLSVPLKLETVRDAYMKMLKIK